MSNENSKFEDTISISFERRIAQLRLRFGQSLNRGEAPQISTLLAECAPSQRRAVLVHLLGLELEFRIARGESPTTEEYVQRFPNDKEIVEQVFASLASRRDGIAASANRPGERAAIDVPVLGVSGYEVVREIGRGGMGVVYEAIQKGRDRRVALKVLITGKNAGQRATQLFLREASALSQLRHKRIVEFYEVGMDRGQIFLAMEYIDAIDLSAYLAERPRAVQIRNTCGIMCQVLAALSYAHGKGIVHRDVKPGNILVYRQDGKLRTKLADFGLAKYYDAAGFSGMTTEGEIRGTLTFMAPEQLANSRYANPACDIYAVGAALYYILAGTHPYEFGSSSGISEIRRLVRTSKPVPLRQRCPDLPASLTDVVHTALAKDPRQRFPSARAMYIALQPFARRSP